MLKTAVTPTKNINRAARNVLYYYQPISFRVVLRMLTVMRFSRGMCFALCYIYALYGTVVPYIVTAKAFMLVAKQA